MSSCSKWIIPRRKLSSVTRASHYDIQAQCHVLLLWIESDERWNGKDRNHSLSFIPINQSITMPRDGDTGKVPLKRGDACLYCRKRRIKCSAEKPSCSQCNGRRECTYDNGKPISRVRQLEDKVAQLEGMLLQTSSRRPSESEPNGESSGVGSGSGSGSRNGNIHTNSSGNTDSTPASDVNMQQDPVPSNSGFSFEGTGEGMNDMNMFDLNAIQQQFNHATSGLSNDFFSFGGSMFGDTSQATNLPTLSNPNQDATTMFDFSTLDPNFMSLVNSFDSTFNQSQSAQTQTQPLPNIFQSNAQGGPSQPFASVPQSQNPRQPNSFAATVTEVADSSTGFTPYLNPDYSPSGNDPSPSLSTGYPLSREDNSAPTPGRHYDHLSQMVANNIRAPHEPPAPIVGEPTWNTGPNTGIVFGSEQTPSQNSNHPLGLKSYPEPGTHAADVVISQALGDKSPEDPAAYANQTSTSYSTFFQKPADTRAGLGAALDQEGYELVGGWFDANDLPRVARDHL
jgi:hypothetical protein